VSVDLRCSSLTKLFSGVGNVMAGSLTVNGSGRHAADLEAELQSMLALGDIPQLALADLVQLEINSRS